MPMCATETWVLWDQPATHSMIWDMYLILLTGIRTCVWEEPATILLNEHSIKLLSKYLFLYPYIGIDLTLISEASPPAINGY